jgi:two-component system phosphate regulon sensor histidine kinase PhoR
MVKKYLYISLFIISIIGLSVVQYQYFRIGLNLAGLQFDENMREAMTDMKTDLGDRNELTYLVATSITGKEENFKLSLDSIRDATEYFFNDFVKSTLVEHGIKADFTYELYARDSVVFLRSSRQFDESDEVLSYPMALKGYLTESTNKDLTLEIRFKNVNRYFLSQLNGLTIPSLVFILIIISILIWVFRAFYLQKNLITSTNEFINNLTHELKTPVFSMGVASKILEEKIDGESKEVVGLMRTQLDKMKNQIDKVLELAIIEGKKDVLVMEKFDLYPQLDRIGSDFGSLVNLEGGEFAMDLRDPPYWFSGDKYHIDNAVNSLLENAKKYSKGPVKIKLMAFKDKNQLRIQVSDQGIGISKDVQKKIFDKYFRVSNGDLHDVKGYGLGLHYVKRIVNLHKGKIHVVSEEGIGSTFTMILPLLKQV